MTAKRPTRLFCGAERTTRLGSVTRKACLPLSCGRDTWSVPRSKCMVYSLAHEHIAVPPQEPGSEQLQREADQEEEPLAADDRLRIRLDGQVAKRVEEHVGPL